MSGDMNLTRPSTRVRIAPGGASTITFGDPSTTTVRTTPAPTTSPAVIAPTPEGVSCCQTPFPFKELLTSFFSVHR